MPEFKHFFLTDTSTSERYTATSGGSVTFRSPPRDSREGHGNKLLGELAKAREDAAAREQAAEPNVEGVVFVPLVMEGDVGDHNDRKLSGVDIEKLDSEAKEVMGCAFGSANTIVVKLEKLRLVREITGQERSRRYQYEPYVPLFDPDKLSMQRED